MQQSAGFLDVTVIHALKSKTALFSHQWIMYKILCCREKKDKLFFKYIMSMCLV